MNSWRSLLPVLTTLPLGLMPQQGAAQPVPSKPNVIFIYADDLGYGDVGFNGSRTIRTPHLDRLAKQGVRFTNMHSPAATCTPSRYALLTGEYAWRRPGTGIATGDAGAIITPERYTLADLFKSAGYQTGVVGKWHLGLGEKTGMQNWNEPIAPGPAELGFDYSFILPATGDRVPCVYVENQRVVDLDPNDPIAVSYQKNFDGEPTGKLNPERLTMHPSHGHDMSIVNGISRIGFMKGGKQALWKDEEIAEVLTQKAIAFIEKQKDHPFFLYLATHDIHVPRVPHPRFAGKSGMGPRGDAILEFDWTIGQVRKTLKRLGIGQNTLVIVTSDNGPVVDDGYKDQAVEKLGNHKPAADLRGGKYSSYEGGTRVPGLVWWPAVVRPGVSDALLCQVDLIASFAHLLAVSIPAGGAPDSQDQLSSWINQGGTGRLMLVLQNSSNNLSIEDGRWKYIAAGPGSNRYPENNIEQGNFPYDQLYDLSNDRSERHNLAPEHPEIVARMKQELQRIKRDH